MISFRISAPGKVILFGEHAVVYGKTAVATSLNCRSSLDFNELSFDENYIHVDMPKLDFSIQISINQVKDTFFSNNFPKLNDEGHDKFLQNIRKFVETLGCNESRQKNSLECFFYALVQVAQSNSDFKLCAFKVKLNTELSIGAGAGSSASFAVCLVAAFLYWSQLQNNLEVPSKFDSVSLEKISKYALNCEKIMHGMPSGIDNSICTWGSVIEFRKGEKPNFIPLGSKSLKILLVDTKVGRSTKVLVDKVAGLTTKYPEIFHKILETIDALSKQSINIIKKMQTVSEDDKDELLEAYRKLSDLVSINQGLLYSCQVSHSTLDMICSTANKYGFSAKLTGAGGGGFAYVLIPPDASAINIQNLSCELTERGFTVTETNLGGSGVEIHKINNAK